MFVSLTHQFNRYYIKLHEQKKNQYDIPLNKNDDTIKLLYQTTVNNVCSV